MFQKLQKMRAVTGLQLGQLHEEDDGKLAFDLHAARSQ